MMFEMAKDSVVSRLKIEDKQLFVSNTGNTLTTKDINSLIFTLYLIRFFL